MANNNYLKAAVLVDKFMTGRLIRPKQGGRDGPRNLRSQQSFRAHRMQ